MPLRALVRVCACIAAVLLAIVFLPIRPAQGGENARPITSLSRDERAKLPDNTLVTLKSGHTVSLGALRADHRALLERFARAGALGKSVASQLAMSARSAHPAPPPNARVGSGTKPQIPITGVLAHLPHRVPFKMPVVNWVHMPKDYFDFCMAAEASACLYLPPNTSFSDPSANHNDAFVIENDPLIVDDSVCSFDGGLPGVAGCVFVYPQTLLTNFQPTGPLSTNAACPPPAKYTVDPKGAIQVSYAVTGQSATGTTPVTCVVQVWISD